MALFKKKKKKEDSQADVNLGDMGALTDADRSSFSKKKKPDTFTFEEDDEAPPVEATKPETQELSADQIKSTNIVHSVLKIQITLQLKIA